MSIYSPGQDFLAIHLHQTPGMFHQTDRGQSTPGSEHTGKARPSYSTGPSRCLICNAATEYGVKQKLRENLRLIKKKKVTTKMIAPARTDSPIQDPHEETLVLTPSKARTYISPYTRPDSTVSPSVGPLQSSFEPCPTGPGRNETFFTYQRSRDRRLSNCGLPPIPASRTSRWLTLFSGQELNG